VLFVLVRRGEGVGDRSEMGLGKGLDFFFGVGNAQSCKEKNGVKGGSL